MGEPDNESMGFGPMSQSHYRRLNHMKRSEIVLLVHQVTKDGNSQISKVKKIAAEPKERK